MESTTNDAASQDALIRAQKDALAKEIADSTPMVGDREGISALEEEFAGGDPVFLAKSRTLAKTYSGLRRTRPDGNCFFRALGFRYFETLLTDANERRRFREEVIAPSKDVMTSLGFPQFTVEDFYDTFLEQLGRLDEEGFSADDLLKMYQDQGTSDYLVVFLRLLTSKRLQQREDFYQCFMDSGRTVKDFCSTDVEPMYVESDHIHVIALAEDLGVPVRIMYLDRGDNEEASAHDFPEGGGKSLVHLLYRPGHYDVLYPKE